LITWLNQHNVCREISRADLESGNVAEKLDELWSAQRPQPVIPGGGAQIADWLAEKLRNQTSG